MKHGVFLGVWALVHRRARPPRATGRPNLGSTRRLGPFGLAWGEAGWRASPRRRRTPALRRFRGAWTQQHAIDRHSHRPHRHPNPHPHRPAAAQAQRRRARAVSSAHRTAPAKPRRLGRRRGRRSRRERSFARFVSLVGRLLQDGRPSPAASQPSQPAPPSSRRASVVGIADRTQRRRERAAGAARREAEPGRVIVQKRALASSLWPRPCSSSSHR